jgi:solute:Na+ symporter, SSS family
MDEFASGISHFAPGGSFTLSVWDYAIIIAYFAFCMAIGVIFKRRAERGGMDSFVLAGRSLPWWLIGTSMVATTFSAETPLLVSNWVYKFGISKNWEWWCLLPGAMLTTFLFAKLWRRTEVLTDAQYLTLRYSGKEAHILRAFRALYMGFVMNTIMIGSQLVVSGKFGTTLMGVTEADASYPYWRVSIALVCALVALFYSSMAGIAGIVVNDFVQFTLAMTGAILVCVYAVARPEVGGLGGLVQKVSALDSQRLAFIPQTTWADGGRIGLTMLLFLLTVRWWAQVYGGAEPGGASHVAQRMLSARSEKDALYGTLWFNIAHYALRPWPWILTGLACLFIFPGAPDGERAYIRTLDFVPSGLKGLVLAGFFSALMAIDTRLNMGAAYFVNDFYRPYLVPSKSDRHYVNVSRLITCVQLLLAFSMFSLVTRVESIFFITLAIGSGTGLVFLLRWYWWRVSAWSEISAMAAGLINLLVFRFIVYPGEKDFNDHTLTVQMFSIAVVTGVWILITLFTRPSDEETLKAFYRKVRPAGPFWGPIARQVKEEDPDFTPGYRVDRSLIAWASGVAMIYFILFGTGKLLLGQTIDGLSLIGAAAAMWAIMRWAMQAAITEPEAARQPEEVSSFLDR